MSKLTKSQFDATMKLLKKDGKLTASGILKEASKKGSPLHCLFEWDDAKASHQYRMWQSRSMVKRLNLSIDVDEEKLVHVPVVNAKEGAYKPVKVVVKIISDFEMAMDEAVIKLAAAERSVKLLQDVALKESPDRAAVLGVAIKSLETASEALKHLH